MHATTTRPARPEPSTLYLDTIPVTLKIRHQWVCWRYEWRDGKGGKPGKWTKVPINPRNGRNASSTDPQTWSSLEHALETMRREHLDGIGFVFAADGPHCGIDLDDAFRFGKLLPWAQEIVDRFASYAEVSVSGNGLHIIVEGKLPAGRRRKDKVEMYHEGRFFTVTGEHWPDSPLTVEPCQDELDALHADLFPDNEEPTPTRIASQPVDLSDQELLGKMFDSEHGRDISVLYHGNNLPQHESDSEGDLALCSHLAWWTGGDANRMDAMFRASARYRDKWDRIHDRRNGSRTYGEMTIDKALSGVTDFYTPNGTYMTIEEAAHVNPEIVVPDRPGPPLPEEARAVYRHLNNRTGRWLFEYVKFASSASPMTPGSFHEAAGLFAVATVIARRLNLPVSVDVIYPNLYLLFIAKSTLYSKTTGFKLLQKLLREADADHLLLPQRMTDEAMNEELSLNVPMHFGRADARAREQWLCERAFAAQRGWAIDEAHSLLDGFKRDYNAGNMAKLLKWYECPEEDTVQSKGTWRTMVSNIYLNFFGATTPSSVITYLNDDRYWLNGLWPRFALIVPDSPPVFEFWPAQMEFPATLVDRLREIMYLFPVPMAEMVEREGPDGNTYKEVEIYNQHPAEPVMLDEGVWQAWETYSRVTRHEMLQANDVEDRLFPAYGRMGTQVIKVAMILAAMDTEQLPVRITLPHYAHAQMIVESWRAALAQLQQVTSKTEESSLQDKVLETVTQLPAEGGLIRDVYRPLGIKAKECRELLNELQSSGQVEMFKGKAANGRMVDMVRRVQ